MATKPQKRRNEVRSTAYTIATMQDGSVITVSESPDRRRILFRIFLQNGGVAGVELDKEQWGSLTDLRYSLDVDDVPTVTEETAEEDVPAFVPPPPDQTERRIDLPKLVVQDPEPDPSF